MGWISAFKTISAASVILLSLFNLSIVDSSFQEGNNLLFHLMPPESRFVCSKCLFNLQILLQLYRKCFGELPVTGLEWHFCYWAALNSWDHGALKAWYMVKTLQDSLGKTYYSLVKIALISWFTVRKLGDKLLSNLLTQKNSVTLEWTVV